ncbi:MAG: hypothetical protein LBV75_03835 [Paludibacter sp.]|jgi:hypothetical protein|nr:hypothetical protein [Paludibacter sp.]
MSKQYQMEFIYNKSSSKTANYIKLFYCQASFIYGKINEDELSTVFNRISSMLDNFTYKRRNAIELGCNIRREVFDDRIEIYNSTGNDSLSATIKFKPL